MLLLELFDQAESVRGALRQTALDLLTPMVAQGVPFVTVQQIIDGLRATRPGIVIDRALILDLFNPQEVPAVSKIEGDRVYLTPPTEPADGSTDADAERQRSADHVHATAQKVAKQDIAKSDARPAQKAAQQDITKPDTKPTAKLPGTA